MNNNKIRLVVFLLIALLAVGSGGNAHAQFWKKKKDRKEKKYSRRHKSYSDESTSETTATSDVNAGSKKELKRREKRERKRLKRERKRLQHNEGDDAGTKVTKVKKGKKKHVVEYPPTQMKPSYRIDFLASLYLDELDKKPNQNGKTKVSEKAFPGISFYEGLTIAADSLKKAGFSVDIYVHDIASANEVPEVLIANGRLDSADLIIGAFHSQDMPVIAAFAKKKKINFVSALSPADGGIKDNQFFTMVQPSLKTHCEWIIDDIAKKYPGKNVVLLHRAATQVDENAFNYINSYNDGYVHFKDVMCNGVPEKESFAQMMEGDDNTVFVISVIDPMFADSVLTALSDDFRSTHFEIYGMPSWIVIDDLHEDGSLPNLSVNVTQPFNIDNTGPVAKYVARKFKTDYGGKPSELVYRGFETMFWYSNLLRQYGTIFNLNYSDVSAAPFTKYDIQLKKDKEGNVIYHENNHIYLNKFGTEGTTSKAD